MASAVGKLAGSPAALKEHHDQGGVHQASDLTRAASTFAHFIAERVRTRNSPG